MKKKIDLGLEDKEIVDENQEEEQSTSNRGKPGAKMSSRGKETRDKQYCGEPFTRNHGKTRAKSFGEKKCFSYTPPLPKAKKDKRNAARHDPLYNDPAVARFLDDRWTEQDNKRRQPTSIVIKSVDDDSPGRRVKTVSRIPLEGNEESTRFFASPTENMYAPAKNGYASGTANFSDGLRFKGSSGQRQQLSRNVQSGGNEESTQFFASTTGNMYVTDKNAYASGSAKFSVPSGNLSQTNTTSYPSNVQAAYLFNKGRKEELVTSDSLLRQSQSPSKKRRID